MSVSVVVGLQWGDEGKGKIIDVLSPQADYVVRYQGGNNAGHTVVVNGEKFILQLLPSGVVGCPGSCIIGPGVVVNPEVLANEINRLDNQGANTDIKIDYRSHIIMPYHLILDELKEEAKGDDKVGTTKRGIGPCYMDKYDRIGFRMGDLLLDDDSLKTKLAKVLVFKNKELNAYGHDNFNFDEAYQFLINAKNRFSNQIIDIYAELQPAIKEDKTILLEGAQALMLDIDYGTYPYVTSSSPTSGGASVGSGINPLAIDKVYGVMKAYATRVGEGPFPTQLDDEIGQHLRDVGHEYGTNTKRPRRCGWLDLVLAKYAIDINGVTDLVITKLDVLDQLETVKVAVAYKINGEVINTPPINFDTSNLEVVYKEFDGWQEDTTGITKFEDLPINCQKYLNFVQEFLDTKLRLVSVGPDRNQNIIM